MTIWKSKGEVNSSSSRHIAGDKQERDVAFYLRRAFKDSKDYIILNDYAFCFNDENAQIDHLIIHRYGLLIIESKSIYGEVKVNKIGEWSRSYKGQWTGMKSPIKQAELQQSLLKQMLATNVDKFLGKILGFQQGIGGRKWDAYCAVSNSCILHRDNIPKEINGRIIKSEAVVDAVRSIGERSFVKSLVKSDPAFSHEEMESIANYLISQERNTEEPPTPTVIKGVPQPEVSEPPQIKTERDNPKSYIACKKCGDTDHLEGRYGKYGYYVYCELCETNTSMRQPCVRCNNTKVKVTKKKSEYWVNCECSSPYLLFTQQVKVSS